MSNTVASAAIRDRWRTDIRSSAYGPGASTFALAVGEVLIAFVEQSSKFLKPVYPGDTLYPMLEFIALTPQRSTGVVTLAATVHNQKRRTFLAGEQKMLLRKRRAAGE